jgi:general nucleoside transport system permease protein
MRIEARTEISRPMIYAAPVVAVVLTMVAGFVLFMIMGHNPTDALYTFFVAPVSTLDGLAELGVKGTPLILIGIGLSFGFRANIWNIGAEGQLTIGALAGGALALAFYEVDSLLLLPGMLLVSALGGMAWAAIPAFLKTKYNANEILTSLMLTYIGLLILSLLIHGPLKDPDGMNFPESRLFHDAAILPVILEDTRLHAGFLIALAAVATAWVILGRHIIGFQIRVIGMAPRAASFAGFGQKKIVWLSFMVAGAAAGVAGISEVAGPLGQVVPVISPGYGFTAIIVAFVGRLHPVGILFAGLLMALSYLGGENAQIEMNMPNAVTGVFQGMLLFFLLGCDVLIKYRLRFK